METVKRQFDIQLASRLKMSDQLAYSLESLAISYCAQMVGLSSISSSKNKQPSSNKIESIMVVLA